MIRYLVAQCGLAVLFSGAALAQDMVAGAPVTVTSAWHEANGGPYTVQIVTCGSSSGLCARDRTYEPEDVHIAKTDDGLRAVYKSVNVVYLFRPGGQGTFHDLTGKQLGTFS